MGDVPSEGTSNAMARANHVHGLEPYTGAVTTCSAAAGTNGNSGDPARGNHTHTIASGGVGAIVPDVTQDPGTSTNLARADHRHACTVQTPAACSAAAATAGTADNFVRGDHTHQITTSGTDPADVNGTGNANPGASDALARADHKHQIDWSSGGLWPMVIPEITAPAGTPDAGTAFLFVDVADGDLKIKFTTGTVTIATKP